VLFGIADDEVAGEAQCAHDRAVAVGFEYLERHIAFGRRGTDGVERIEGAGLVAAAFVHRTSRAGDPHLHTHVLVANLVFGRDGRWSALDARLLYAHAKTASFLYQAALRMELTRELGVAWEPVHNGIAELRGEDKPVNVDSRRVGDGLGALEQEDQEPHGAQRRARASRCRHQLAGTWRVTLTMNL
jgi:conjugative relaxase-like TrwC/TraI family protein